MTTTTNGGEGGLGKAGNGGGGSSGLVGDGPGIACDRPFEVSSELQGCIATVGGIEFKFFPLAAGTAVKRVAVYLHGDTAVDWKGWYPFLATTVEWCKQRDILVVAPLSPVSYDGDPPNEPSFGAALGADTKKVGEALELIIDAYSAPHQGLLYWGMSGGSWFATSSFIPLFGARLPGAYALSCGGSEFWYDYAWNIDGPARAQNKLRFIYGSEDFLRDGEEASAKKYEDDGFSVSVKTYLGAEHCQHPIHEPTVEFWATTL